MPGKVLIIDDIATNRIVLKVKLSAASYQVLQAASAVEGLAVAARERPDLILCSAQVSDMDPGTFARALRAAPQARTIPLLFEAIRRDPEWRHALLEAGADDILLKPVSEQLLLARMRSLLRVKETTEELHLREGASRALGLAEAPEEYSHAGHVALVANDQSRAGRLARGLGEAFRHRAEILLTQDALRRIDASHPPDAVALCLEARNAGAALQLISDLRARADTRECGILVLVPAGDAQSLAAEALDRGANDILFEGFSPRELALRLDRLVGRKRMLERLRSDMRDGLRAALTDPLTGLFNRRHALPRLAAIAAASDQSGRDYAAMIIDIDHFKLVNDRFGHAAGDAVLSQMAETLSALIGPADILARIGGEEFLLVLPDTEARAAQLSAMQLCETVRRTPFRVPGREQPLRITVSIGVAMGREARPDAKARGKTRPQFTYEAVLSRADKALYAAKEQGRNQVTFSVARSAA